MSTADLLPFPTIDEPPATAASVQVAVKATPSEIDLKKIDLTDVALAQFGNWRADVAQAAETLKDVAWDVSTTKGLTDIKDVRNKVSKIPRADANKTADALVSKLTQVNKRVRTEQALIVAAYDSLAAPLSAVIDEREAVLAAEKAERDRIEAERVAKHRAGIETIRGYAVQAQGKTAWQIASGIDRVRHLSFGPEWDEFTAEAFSARDETVAALMALHDQTHAREAEAARIETQRIEQARVAAEQAERQRQLDEMAADMHRKMEAIAAKESAAAALAEQQRFEAAQADAAWAAGQRDREAQGRANAAIIAAQNSQRQESANTPALDSQHVLKAEATGPDATDRENPATRSPVGGPMGVEQPAAADLADDLMLLRDALAFTEYAAAPFFGKFPTHPKTTPEWWSGLREQIERLQPLLIAAIEVGEGAK